MIFMKESKARARGSMVKAENTVVLQRQAKGGEGGKKDAEHKRGKERGRDGEHGAAFCLPKWRT